MPTAICNSRLRPGRQCPLGSGARGGGPAVPTGIWTARRRRRVRRRRRRRRRALLKSSNPHLAGGEPHGQKYRYGQLGSIGLKHAHCIELCYIKVIRCQYILKGAIILHNPGQRCGSPLQGKNAETDP